MHDDNEETGPYGMMAEFGNPEDLIAAAERVHEAGYRKVEAYTPYPIEEVVDALDQHHTRLPLFVLLGGLLGGTAGYSLQYWASIINYPLNIGGRPLHSWPAFIIPTFECTILGASLAAVLGMILLNGLPMPYHPAFNVRRFAAASSDGYFLMIESRDPKFDAEETRRFLSELNPSEVSDVAR
jgi:hypothetical protein